MADDGLELLRLSIGDDRAAPLRAGLEEEYRVRYGSADEMATVPDAAFDPPGGLFVILRSESRTVAGGGYRRLDSSVCEVKRMWTDPAERRRGHAGVVLSALEDAARVTGYETLRLETGPAQPEAVAFYTARGYRRIPAYGRYPSALAFELDLTARDGRPRP